MDQHASHDQLLAMLQESFPALFAEIVGEISAAKPTENATSNLKENTMENSNKLFGVVCLNEMDKNAHGQMVARTGARVFHLSETAAVHEAERLARANPGKSFGTFTLTSVSAVAVDITSRI